MSKDKKAVRAEQLKGFDEIVQKAIHAKTVEERARAVIGISNIITQDRRKIYGISIFIQAVAGVEIAKLYGVKNEFIDVFRSDLKRYRKKGRVKFVKANEILDSQEPTFSKKILTLDRNSKEYSDLYFDFAYEMRKAVGGRICTPERMAQLYPIFKEINEETERDEAAFAEIEQEEKAKLNLSEMPAPKEDKCINLAEEKASREKPLDLAEVEAPAENSCIDLARHISAVIKDERTPGKMREAMEHWLGENNSDKLTDFVESPEYIASQICD